MTDEPRGDGYSRREIPEDAWPEELRLSPKAQEVKRAFEEALAEMSENVIGEGSEEAFRQAFEDETLRAFRRELEARGCPEEKIVELLSEVEIQPADAEPGDASFIVRFDFWLPTEMQDWLDRRPVRYDPGVPPV